MRRKLAGVCVLAVASLVGLGAASADAAEQLEYARCTKVSTKPANGKFSDKSCSTSAAANGKFELSAATGIVQRGKGGAVVFRLPSQEGRNITCTSTKALSTITGPKTSEGELKFFGCEFIHRTCTGPGANKGVGKVDVAYELDYTPPSEVSILITFKHNLVFDCRGLPVEISGQADGVQTGDVNTISNTATDTWSGGPLSMEANLQGQPNPTAFETTIVWKSKAMEVIAHS